MTYLRGNGLIAITPLPRFVEVSFNRALASPSPALWKSCSVIAGGFAVRMAADGELFLAAAMEGVAEEAKRQMLAMIDTNGAKNEPYRN